MNLQKPNYVNLHQNIAQTQQDYLSVDLIVPYKSTTKGNTYALTAICNLTGYLTTSPIPDKKPSEIFLKFGFTRILHSNNGTKFKLKLIEHATTRCQENLHLPLPPPIKWKIRILT